MQKILIAYAAQLAQLAWDYVVRRSFDTIAPAVRFVCRTFPHPGDSGGEIDSPCKIPKPTAPIVVAVPGDPATRDSNLY
jgi:hypothetical protein